jgi:hypothetical protein
MSNYIFKTIFQLYVHYYDFEDSLLFDLDRNIHSEYLYPIKTLMRDQRAIY